MTNDTISRKKKNYSTVSNAENILDKSPPKVAFDIKPTVFLVKAEVVQDVAFSSTAAASRVVIFVHRSVNCYGFCYCLAEWDAVDASTGDVYGEAVSFRAGFCPG